MNEVRFELPQGTFHALARDGERPLLFLHGFPDFPPTAAAFFAALTGRKLLAPYLRGYAPSPIHGPFNAETLVGDLVDIIERWSPGKPVDVVGHDWGAILTYWLCIVAPERVRRAVTLAVPHPLTFLRQLRTPAQLRASWYMGLFQLPGSDQIVKARNFRLIDRLWRRWSPGFTLDKQLRSGLHACLAASKLAPLAYYREMRRGLRGNLRKLAQPIATPLLALHGANDGCIVPPTIDERKRFTGEYQREVVTDVGHFLHLEAPAVIAARVAAWLE